jgi:anti-anti-sigma factor
MAPDDGRAVHHDFSVAIAHAPHETRVYLRGELDPLSAPVMDRAVAEAVEGAECLVLDCAGLSSCDSSGIRSFVLAAGRCAANGVEFKLEHVYGRVRDLLHVTGLDDLLGS